MASTQTLSMLAPLAVPLPSPPEGDILTPDQWTVLLGICETFVPSISNSSNEKNEYIKNSVWENAVSELRSYMPGDTSSELAEDFLKESAIANPEFKAALHRKFSMFIPPSAVQGLASVMSALNTRLGSVLLTGSTTPIHKQDLATRTKIICNWAESYLPPLRAIHRSLSGLTRLVWVSQSATIPKILDFPFIPKHTERKATFDFKFHTFSDPSAPTTIETDVIIAGSGCGAGVMASHLSRSGLKCLILEKSYHFPSTHFPMTNDDAGEHLLENGGTISTDDNSMIIMAGSTLGGGGTVNWSASLQPQNFVREEWAAEGLTQFLSSEFQDCLDTVCERMGASKINDPQGLSKIQHNFANRTLLEGARRLGMASEIVPQNNGSKEHYCGYCGTGCASTTKQGPANCWLPDAANHGAEFIEGCFVDEIIFSESSPKGQKKATGVKATWTSRDRSITRNLIIKAPRVIVAGGSLSSPPLLLRSGLSNPHIGSNLHLHPVAVLWAVWPNRVNPWEGPILTSAVTALENHDGNHHGPKLEVIFSTPQFALPAMIWRPSLSLKTQTKNTDENDSIWASALDYKQTCAKFAHTTGYLSLQRDRDTGKVYIDPTDKSRRRIKVQYTASPHDRNGISAGLLAAARIAYTMGALELNPTHPGILPFKRSKTAEPETNDAAFEAWLAELKGLGITSPDPCLLGSAHQMGSCRMATSPDRGVVDSKGRVWGTENVYIADSSVFPSASGVNPMVTTMGIAEWIARGIVKEDK